MPPCPNSGRQVSYCECGRLQTPNPRELPSLRKWRKKRAVCIPVDPAARAALEDDARSSNRH